VYTHGHVQLRTWRNEGLSQHLHDRKSARTAPRAPKRWSTGTGALEQGHARRQRHLRATRSAGGCPRLLHTKLRGRLLFSIAHSAVVGSAVMLDNHSGASKAWSFQICAPARSSASGIPSWATASAPAPTLPAGRVLVAAGAGPAPAAGEGQLARVAGAGCAARRA
jgi:hypothetical protein